MYFLLLKLALLINGQIIHVLFANFVTRYFNRICRALVQSLPLTQHFYCSLPTVASCTNVRLK